MIAESLLSPVKLLACSQAPIEIEDPHQIDDRYRQTPRHYFAEQRCLANCLAFLLRVPRPCTTGRINECVQLCSDVSRVPA